MNTLGFLRNILALIGGVAVIVSFVGIYKFNIVGDDVVFVENRNTQAGILFSQATGKWFDHIGVCHTCTPENGFGEDGTLETQGGVIVWKELRLTLVAKTGGTPSMTEVRTFFDKTYASKINGFNTQVFATEQAYDIYVPVDKVAEKIDFMDPEGALLRTYEVSETSYDQIPELVIANHAQRLARTQVMETKIFQQNGYDLKLDYEYKPVDRIFVYSFKHHGDPQSGYTLEVRVQGNGRIVVAPSP
jgi:hypothetical protein